MANSRKQKAEAISERIASDPRVAGLLAFHHRRKQNSREQLLAAASEKFCELGYFATSVEDIAAAGGVSRMTFYRHFSSKADLAAGLFEATAQAAMPRYLVVTTIAIRDRAAILAWITSLFEADKANRALLRVFTQAIAEQQGFTERAQALIRDLIRGMGAFIPAFAIDPDQPRQRRRWLEAWLLIYEILDQSNHSALNSGVAADPLVIEILADHFLAFVSAYPA